MQVSDLIKDLNDIIEKHGDILVGHHNMAVAPGIFWEFVTPRIVRVRTNKNNRGFIYAGHGWDYMGDEEGERKALMLGDDGQ